MRKQGSVRGSLVESIASSGKVCTKQLMASQGFPAVENHEEVVENLTRQLSNLTVKGDVKEEPVIKKG